MTMAEGSQLWRGRHGHHKAILLALSLALNFYLLGFQSDRHEGHEDQSGEADDPPTMSLGRSLAGRSLTGRTIAGIYDGFTTGFTGGDVQGPADESSDLDAGVRRLNSHSGSSSSSGSGTHTGASSGSALDACHAEHHGAAHHDAMLFLFDAFVVGAFVMHLLTHLPFLQETVVLFILGLLYSLVMEGLEYKDCEIKYSTSKFGVSYDMWMEIDPHLILFTMLPALLAGDAMTIDTSIAKRVAGQCLYFAGPGVLINAGVVAVILKYLLDWKPMLAMTTASILCATDPVAVVALLKELGASPVLTVQIQGESLLNDGTAIVLYMVSYDLLKGEKYDVIDILMFLVEKAFLAFGMGMFIGYFFFTWIRLASNKLEHHSGMIQIVLTLCCAYWSFIMAEGVMHLSGVLSTVAASLVLAHHMWPHVVSPESMHHVWHTFEALGNIIIFFLAGALTGNVMVHIDGINYLYLLVIYVVLVIVRGSVIFASRPLLKYLSADRQPVSAADASVMAWGGLRGAVGLALAIHVQHDQASKVSQGEAVLDSSGRPIYEIDPSEGQQVLFFVAGIAFLTMIVNATTAPYLVGWLEITALPHSQQKLLHKLSQQLTAWTKGQDYPETVTESLEHMMHHIEEEILHQKVRKTAGNGNEPFTENKVVIEKYNEAEVIYKALPQSGLKLIGDIPEKTMIPEAANMIEMIKEQAVDVSMARAVNKAFLGLVNGNYWKQIELGNMRPGTTEAEVLLSSIRVTPLHADLLDWSFVSSQVDKQSRDEGVEEDLFAIFSDAEGKPKTSAQDKITRMIRSAPFNIFIAVLILLNGLYVGVDYLGRTSNNEDNVGWLVMECIFTVIFFVEMVLKIIGMKMDYFRDNWNKFDFFLVWLGVLGFSLSVVVFVSDGGQDVAKLVRISRVFRLLRFLRVIRLFHQKMGADNVSKPASLKMHRILTLLCFIHAHLNSQVEIVKYFGGNGKLDEKEECEIARCILQSLTAVYIAQDMVLKEEKEMEQVLIDELQFVKIRKRITEGLEKFVMEAYGEGAISAREAESILHPMHHHLEACMKEMVRVTDGDKGLLARQLDKVAHAHEGVIGQAVIGQAKQCTGAVTHAASAAGHAVSDHHPDKARPSAALTELGDIAASSPNLPSAQAHDDHGKKPSKESPAQPETSVVVPEGAGPETPVASPETKVSVPEGAGPEAPAASAPSDPTAPAAEPDAVAVPEGESKPESSDLRALGSSSD
jgi:NhaP-type Na+/H+ or K+/H+ antiporter